MMRFVSWLPSMVEQPIRLLLCVWIGPNMPIVHSSARTVTVQKGKKVHHVEKHAILLLSEHSCVREVQARKPRRTVRTSESHPQRGFRPAFGCPGSRVQLQRPAALRGRI